MSDYDWKPSTRNLTVGISDIVAWLSGKKGTTYKSHYMYPYLMNKFDNDENVAKSYALRLLIHYIGDLVQPFHCENRFNKEFPKGDKGGNAFPLPNHYSIDELHALWDKVLYEERNNIARPFTDSSWTSFQAHLDEILGTYSYAVAGSSVYKTTNYDKWANESLSLAKTLYEGVTENEAVPQAYLDKNVPIAYERLVIGGYRLYYTINYIFGDSDEFDDNVMLRFTEKVLNFLE